jgi:Ran GTPase-activating protein (RanGAP) involved in mRNA processing and transport
MTGTAIDSEAVTALVEVLRVNKSIVKLYLWGNSIGPDGAITIIRGLEHNSSLRELRISRQRCRLGGRQGYGRRVDERMKSLTTLDFCSNRITDEGGKALVAALKINVTCRVFWHSRQPIE